MAVRCSSIEREEFRRRWRGFLLPRWKTLTESLLTADEAKVVGLRLGIVNDLALTHGQIARRMGCSNTRVSQLERHAFRKLAAAMKGEGPHETA
jgi:DNA-directed RNA polymerase sigma subunit (sigma70/sigma32)